MSFAIGLIAAIVFAVLAHILQRMARAFAWSVTPVILLAISALLAHVFGIVLGILTVPQFQYWDAASIFAVCVMSYVFAFGAVYKSVSLAILLDLTGRPGRAAPVSEIVEGQVPRLFQGRTQILVDGGLVEQTGQRFTATAAGRNMAGRIGWLRRIFGIGDTGLYDFKD